MVKTGSGEGFDEKDKFSTGSYGDFHDRIKGTPSEIADSFVGEILNLGSDVNVNVTLRVNYEFFESLGGDILCHKRGDCFPDVNIKTANCTKSLNAKFVDNEIFASRYSLHFEDSEGRPFKVLDDYISSITYKIDGDEVSYDFTKYDLPTEEEVTSRLKEWGIGDPLLDKEAIAGIRESLKSLGIEKIADDYAEDLGRLVESLRKYEEE